MFNAISSLVPWRFGRAVYMRPGFYNRAVTLLDHPFNTPHNTKLDRKLPVPKSEENKV